MKQRKIQRQALPLLLPLPNSLSFRSCSTLLFFDSPLLLSHPLPLSTHLPPSHTPLVPSDKKNQGSPPPSSFLIQKNSLKSTQESIILLRGQKKNPSHICLSFHPFLVLPPIKPGSPPYFPLHVFFLKTGLSLLFFFFSFFFFSFFYFKRFSLLK